MFIVLGERGRHHSLEEEFQNSVCVQLAIKERILRLSWVSVCWSVSCNVRTKGLTTVFLKHRV